MYRRFGAVLLGNIIPCIPRGQDVEDAVNEGSGIPPGPIDVRFLAGQEVPKNFPEIVVDFPKCNAQGLGFERAL